jgi:hypothetical protein
MTYRQGVPLLRHALFFTAFFIGLSPFFHCISLIFHEDFILCAGGNV